MINNQIYQDIFDEINEYLPAKWDRIVAYFEYGEASYTFSFYVKNNDKYVKCYDIPGIDEDSIYDSFKKIDEMISDERNRDNENWTVMTMVVTSDGDMKTDYDYTDLSDNAYDFMKAWKEKYLV